MFGYVRPALAQLNEEDKARYQSIYCGLCHTIGDQYGWLPRLLLNYDFAFLALLLYANSGAEQACDRKCPVHPFKGNRRCICGDALNLAAGESVILLWHKTSDDIRDRKLLPGLPYRMLRLLLRRPYRLAKVRNREFDRIVGEKLDFLTQMEANNSPQMDRAADAFAAILSAAAQSCGSETERRAMTQLLYHLGRWIYLVDAWDDREEDKKAGRYNPINTRFFGADANEKEYIETTLTHSLRLCSAAANLLNFGEWKVLIDNVLLQGLPTVQAAVLNGRWKQLNSIKGKRK